MPKIQIGVDKGTYRFNPGSRQVLIDGLAPVQIEALLLITNVQHGTNAIIYDFADPSRGASASYDSQGTLVITLDYDTTAMSASDPLQIFMDYVDESTMLLRRMVKLLEPSQTADANQRQRVVVDSAILASGTITNNLGVVRLDQAGGFGSLFLVDQRYEMADRARMEIVTTVDGLKYLYMMRHTGTEMWRTMLFWT